MRVADIQAGSDDRIWVRDYVPNEETVGTWIRAPIAATRWNALARDGISAGSVELPARFAPLLFGSDWVAGVYRDEVDVEFVHVYALRRS